VVERRTHDLEPFGVLRWLAESHAVTQRFIVFLMNGNIIVMNEETLVYTL